MEDYKAQPLDDRSHPAAVFGTDAIRSTMVSPSSSTQASYLSTGRDNWDMSGENTPVLYRDVPDFVLAKLRGKKSPTGPCAKSSTSSHNQSKSAVRVCLEKKFNTLFADTSAHFSDTPAVCRGSRATPSRKLSKAARDFAGESGSDVKKISPGQRRERHNRKERERRRRIRSYCDELNMLVPFCQSTSGMLATLQWTTAFLKYINDTYGDTLKEVYKKAVAEKKGLFLECNSCGHQEMDKALMNIRL